MCIMAMPVRSVSNTRIFVGVHLGIQLTVYEMAVELATPGNAMILPVPAESVHEVGLIDMSEAPKFFDDADRIYMPMTLGGDRRSRGVDFLEVRNVGNYQVSVAEAGDLDRLNPEVFKMSRATRQALGEHYCRMHGEKYVFVVAQLRESGKFHPLAYTHPVARDGRLFIPTRHEHGHHHDGSHVEGRADWDHHIYHQVRTAKYAETPGTKDRSEARGNQSSYGQVARWAKGYAEKVPDLAPYLAPDQDAWIARTPFKGSLRNIDLHLEV